MHQISPGNSNTQERKEINKEKKIHLCLVHIYPTNILEHKCKLLYRNDKRNTLQETAEEGNSHSDDNLITEMA